jgi:RNA polymerase sigma factor (TIGR02999 family)
VLGYLHLSSGGRVVETADRSEVTRLLVAWGAGDQRALEQLTPLVYHELHRLAHTYMARERSDHTLQATALVHEVYLRMVDLQGVDWRDRAHFFAVAARLMRRILVDCARARGYDRRAVGKHRVSLNEALVIAREPGAEVVAMDDALNRLAELDPRKSQVVELRYFGGLGVEEICEALKISPETVTRDWRAAKAWLYGQLAEGTEIGT